jgi:hypothetical protein
MPNDFVKAKGFVIIKVGGNEVARGNNMVVQAGLDLLAALIYGESLELPSVFHFGTSSASTVISMTGLQGTDLFQKQATVSRSGATLKWVWNGVYTGSAVKVGEIGIFNQSQTMLARFVPIPAFNLKNGANVEISWQITMGE